MDDSVAVASPHPDGAVVVGLDQALGEILGWANRLADDDLRLAAAWAHGRDGDARVYRRAVRVKSDGGGAVRDLRAVTERLTVAGRWRSLAALDCLGRPEAEFDRVLGHGMALHRCIAAGLTAVFAADVGVPEEVTAAGTEVYRQLRDLVTLAAAQPATVHAAVIALAPGWAGSPEQLVAACAATEAG